MTQTGEADFVSGSLPSYRDLLAEELERRRERNSAYSLRAFARDLKLSPAYLSQVLRGLRDLSEERAAALVETLPWTKKKRRLFLQLLRLVALAPGSARGEAEEEVRRLFAKEITIRPLKADVFNAFSDWHHSAILAWSACIDFSPEPDAVAARFGISPEAAAMAIARLKRLGLLVEREGRLVYEQRNISVIPEVPSAAVREYHRQVLGRASQAIERQAMEEREFMGLTVSLDPAILPEIKKKIREFVVEMMSSVETGTPTRVYHFAVQCFRADAPTDERDGTAVEVHVR